MVEIMINMRHSMKTGICFGTTSGIITTLGLMVGLNSGTHSSVAVIGGVLTIAVADALSDALGIHISEESECEHTTREIWESTLSTFLSKFIFASSFIIPLLLFTLSKAVLVSLIWGLILLSLLSFFIARGENKNPWKVISEHLIIALIVILISNYVGYQINLMFS